jgi:hypothetical protein
MPHARIAGTQPKEIETVTRLSTSIIAGRFASPPATTKVIYKTDFSEPRLNSMTDKLSAKS